MWGEGFEGDGFADAFLQGGLEVRECWVQEDQGGVGVSDCVEELFDGVGGALGLVRLVFVVFSEAQWLGLGSLGLVIVQELVWTYREGR